jgi:hypothetical protein
MASEYLPKHEQHSYHSQCHIFHGCLAAFHKFVRGVISFRKTTTSSTAFAQPVGCRRHRWHWVQSMIREIVHPRP